MKIILDADVIFCSLSDAQKLWINHLISIFTSYDLIIAIYQIEPKTTQRTTCGLSEIVPDVDIHKTEIRQAVYFNHSFVKLRDCLLYTSHCTSLDLHQPQHRTAKVAPSFRYTKPNSSIPQAVINPNHKA